MPVSFTKMHGLGNDFVIIDQRAQDTPLSRDAMARIADRHMGVGCDQLIMLREAGKDAVRMDIFNADASPAEACGNATRCVGWLEMVARDCNLVDVITGEGALRCEHSGEQRVRVNMGLPKLAWNDIPLAEEQDTLHLSATSGPLQDAVGVSMGNPHAVFFVEDMERLDLRLHGPRLEHHALFPERVNVGVAQVTSADEIRLRVWERGAGLTQACGTGACAAQVAARRRGLTNPKAVVHLPGGTLTIQWDGSNDDTQHPVWMEGAVAQSFTGILDKNLL